MKIRILLLFLVSNFVVQRSSFSQGPLTPPGPPGPTMKTLDQLDAKLEKRIPITSTGATFNVSGAGSYYLTRDITFSGHGIVITADNVTIDLNGFSLVGTGTGGGTGIVISGAHKNIVVRNGSVRFFGGAGIIMSLGSKSTLENLRVADNKNPGAVIGPTATVTRCSFTSNGTIGLSAAAGAAITDCSAFGNGGHGIQGQNNCIVSGCRTSGNGGDGFNLGNDAEVDRCNANGNTGSGIRVLSGAAITGCVAASNQVYGIYTEDGSIVTGSTARNQPVGIRIGSHAIVSGCAATANTSEGIQTVNGCVVANNIASANGTLDGGGSGIHLYGTQNRVDGNHVIENQGSPQSGGSFGIFSNGGEGADVVIRNISLGHFVNYKPGTGITFAPLQQPKTATNPWANLTQ